MKSPGRRNLDTLIDLHLGTFKDVLDYEKFNLISISFHSTAIEGSTITAQEANVLLDKGISPVAKPIHDQNMLLDHHEALQYTLSLANSNKPLTVSDIHQIASIVMRRTGAVIRTARGDYDTSKGEFRLSTVRAGNRYFESYDKVPSMVGNLIERVNTVYNAATDRHQVLDLAFDLHYQMVMIHPFGDGNGRVSRLLQNYILRKAGLPIFPIDQKRRLHYINALEETAHTKSPDCFRSFMRIEMADFLSTELNSISSGPQQINTTQALKRGIKK